MYLLSTSQRVIEFQEPCVMDTGAPELIHMFYYMHLAVVAVQATLKMVRFSNNAQPVYIPTGYVVPNWRFTDYDVINAQWFPVKIPIGGITVMNWQVSPRSYYTWCAKLGWRHIWAVFDPPTTVVENTAPPEEKRPCEDSAPPEEKRPDDDVDEKHESPPEEKRPCDDKKDGDNELSPKTKKACTRPEPLAPKPPGLNLRPNAGKEQPVYIPTEYVEPDWHFTGYDIINAQWFPMIMPIGDIRVMHWQVDAQSYYTWCAKKQKWIRIWLYVDLPANVAESSGPDNHEDKIDENETSHSPMPKPCTHPEPLAPKP